MARLMQRLTPLGGGSFGWVVDQEVEVIVFAVALLQFRFDASQIVHVIFVHRAGIWKQ
ncbi:hypothetical protein AB0F46_42270 [Streptomyces sp. NPDC026665]|uniref:hypothetical protein n=1 Tax=Streptomyces sp. NPDC026665 TaxID=3154798 RepID=UPI0033D8D163